MVLVREIRADIVKDQTFSSMILNWKSENCHSGFQRKSVNFSNTYYLWIISSCPKKKRTANQNLSSLYPKGHVICRSFTQDTRKQLHHWIHVPLVNDQQLLLISFWLQVFSVVVSKIQGHHFQCAMKFFSSSSLSALRYTVERPTCPSPIWPKSYPFLNSIRDLDFCTHSEYTSAIHARDTLVLAKFLSENDLEPRKF